MAAETEILELEIHIQDVVTELRRLDKEYQRAGKNALDFQQKVANRKRYKEATHDMTLLRKELQRTGKAAKQAGGLQGIGFFGQQVGYLVSDARYGVLGMANNLSIIVPLFQNLQKKAKEAGTTLKKEFGKALLGPTGILIGFQLLIVLLPEIIEFFKSFRSASSKVADELKKVDVEGVKATARLQAFKTIIQSGNSTLKERTSIAKELSRTNKGLIDDNGKLITTEKDLVKAINTSISALEKKAKMKAIEGLLVQSYVDIFKKMRDISDRSPFDITSIIFGEANMDALEAKELKDLKELQGTLLAEFKKFINIVPAELSGFFKKELARLEKNRDKINDLLKSAGERERETLHRHYEEYIDDLDKQLKLGNITQEQYDELRLQAEDNYFARRSILTDENNKKVIAKLNSLLGTEEEITAAKREQELNDLREFLYKKGATEEEIQAAINAQKQKYREIDDKQESDLMMKKLNRLNTFFQMAAQVDEKNKGLKTAAAIANGAVAIVGAWKDWKEGPFGPIGNTAAAITESALIAAVTAKSVKSINNPKSGLSSQGGVSSGPRHANFDIIGAGGTSQLAGAIGETTDRSDQKVVLVTSELEMKQQDQKVTLEQTGIG